MKGKLRFINPVVFVKDIERSKQFYQNIIGLDILSDAGMFVLFENHFSIHQARELEATVFGENTSSSEEDQGKRNLLLYFESDELEDMFIALDNQVNIIHPIIQQTWGQKVFRFYDPDGHIVEIGEPM